jgi:RNA polymerase sigma-70 factor (ECF subfamily)
MGPVLRREYDASDVLQETLLVAAARFAKFHGQDERELLAWLRTLASRKLVDLARRTGRLKRAPSDQVSLDAPQQERGTALVDEIPGDLTSPSQLAARREMAVKLADALGQIDPAEAQVIWLHHVEGLSFEVIGERIGVGRNGVRGIWTRGLRSLRRILPPGGAEFSR